MKTGAKSIVTRADGRSLRRLTIYLPIDLAQQIRVKSVTKDENVSEIIREALEHFFECNQKTKGEKNND